MIEYFKTEKGLPYVDPAALETTALMTQLISVLFEYYKTLVDLEQRSTASISSGSKPPIADPKPHVKTKNSKEPTRPPSIRHKGNKSPTSIISSSAVKLPAESFKRSYETQAGYSSPVVNSRKRNATTNLSKSISSDSSDVGYTKDSLMLKRKENILVL